MVWRPVCGAFLVAAALGGSGCAKNPASPTQTNPPTDNNPPPLVTAVLVGAGDIADCNNDGGRHAEDTAKLLDKIEGTVFTAGDNVYPAGTAQLFQDCYGPRWGRHKNRTRPAAGNHEYEGVPGAFPYFQYFGAAAGERGLGFYSYNVGLWHIVALNSNVPLATGTEQYVWLQNDLAENTGTPCTLVYFHHPRFTSGPSGGQLFRDVWQLMYGLGVDVVVNGHDHGYERFDPQDPDATATARGIREFIVGSGGAPLYTFGRTRNSVMSVSTYGVIKFTLRNTDYDWMFIQAGTEAILDQGTGTCH